MRKIITSILILSSLISSGQSSGIDSLNKLYNSHDFKSVIQKAKPLLDSDPDNLNLNLILGRSYTDMGDYKGAIPYLEFTVKSDNNNSWRKAWGLGYLGTCYFMLQNYDDSERSLNECIKLNATTNATNDAYGKILYFGFNEFYKNWKIVETENFRFHFQNMSDSDIEKFISSREIAYKQINDFFKSNLPKKIDFFVWESNDDARKILNANLGFARPDFCIIHSHFQQTKGHEMTHVISNYLSNSSIKTRFINEGIAVCFDLTQQDRLKLLEDLTKTNNKQVSITDYWQNKNGIAEEILYPLSGLFVKELLDNFGKEKCLEFFKNQSYDNAKSVFGDRLEKVILDLENKINS